MENIQAKTIHQLISKDNRLKAVELSGFIAMLRAEEKCNDELVTDSQEYVGMLSLLWQKFENKSISQIEKKDNPINEKDFALLTKYSIELNEFLKLAKEKI